MQQRAVAQDSPPTQSIQPYWQPAIAGRYRKFTIHGLAMLWWLYQEQRITGRQLRTIFAVHEMDERRRYLKQGQHRLYGLTELRRLIGVGEGRGSTDSALRSDLRRLQALGVLEFEENQVSLASNIDQLNLQGDHSSFWELFAALPNQRRTIPVPRRLLRALAGGFNRSTVGTIFAYLIRCLFWHKDQGSYRVDGRAKATWIAQTFGLSRRAVISARQRLVELGWLKALPAAQWELNRWGGRFLLNTDWKEALPEAANTEFAPPCASKSGEIAPPYKQISSPKGELLNNRNPASGGPDVVSSKEKDRKEAPPNIHNILPADLKDTDRLLQLFESAHARGVAKSSGESALMDFLSLAERARAHGKDPARLFYWLISKERYDMIAQIDEDRARERLRIHRYGEPVRESERPSSPLEATPQPSGDVRVVAAIYGVIRTHGLAQDPFELLQTQRRDWDRQRWDNAEHEYWAWERDKRCAMGEAC